MNELDRADTEDHPLPRMTLRYRTPSKPAQLRAPVKRLVGTKTVEIPAEVIDLSVGGALLALPSDAPITEGTRVDLCFEGEEATVGVRHLTSGNRAYCGVAFRSTTSAFEAAVHAAIEPLVDDPKRREAWRMNGPG